MNCNEPDQTIRHARPNSGSSYMGKAVGRVAPLDFPDNGWQMEAFRALSKDALLLSNAVHIALCMYAAVATLIFQLSLCGR